MTKTVVCATVKTWNIKLFDKWKAPAGYKKLLITDKNRLTYRALRLINPQYIFFLHWSWLIPEDIYKNFNCVVFHMTDLPFGRGGSPLQNLLQRGIYKTKLSAIKVEGGLDSGPVYLKKDFDMKEGSAQEIFEKAAKLDFQMIDEIIERNLEAKPQKGRIVTFKRRSPEQSEIPKGLNARKFYDYVRMLDAEGYPKAYILKDGYKVELSNASVSGGRVYASAQIIGGKR